MTTPSVSQGLPALTQPPLAEQGLFAQTWYTFMNSLWQRTGAAVGGGVCTPGAVIDFAGPAAPLGWLLCDGSAVSRTTYAALFSVVGTTYGPGDGVTTFNLPTIVAAAPLVIGHRIIKA